MTVRLIMELAFWLQHATLTGSRFFETAREDSDWDFATSLENKECSDRIRLRGGKLLPFGAYGIANADVFRYTYEGVQIDVQFRTSPEHRNFLRVQHFIKCHSLYPIGRDYRKRLFEALHELLQDNSYAEDLQARAKARQDFGK